MASPLETAKDWLQFANNDLASVNGLITARIYNNACFHAQQCAEKALKAYIVFKESSIPFTHSLVDLLDILVKDFPDLEQFRKQLQVLEGYSTSIRHPISKVAIDPDTIYSEEKAQKAYHFAKSFLDHIKSKINL